VPGRGPNLPLSSVLLVVVGLVGVSSSGPLMAAATAVPALAISFWRTGLGAVGVGAVAVTRHRAVLGRLARREWVRSGFAGVMLAGHFGAWVSSLKLTSVASATALVSLQVAWVVVLARLSGRTIDRRVWVGLTLSLAGVLVVSGVDGTISLEAVGGDLLAMAGGMFGAVYVTVGGQVREYTTTTAYTFVCYFACAVTLALACAVGHIQLTGFDGRSWMLIIAVTLSAQLLGHSVFNHLLAVMSPTLVSMLLLLEVPGAALLAAVFLGQAPPIAVYAGVGLICAGLALVVRARAGAGPPRLVEAPLD
jgi:drug/metabolite transporter (DMT)-like permease